MKSQEKKLVYIAMSGGVDSSVAAALLKRQGYQVVGVFMKPWSPSISRKLFDYAQGDLLSKDVCLWREDREDAMRVAAVLGIPFLTWDFSKEYKKEVTDYMIREYRAGRTPNPDVMCNDRIKFGIFLQKSLESGADYIATGHYVRLMRKSQIPNHSPRSSKSGAGKSQTNSKIRNQNSKNPELTYGLMGLPAYRLLVAKDSNKDQSYFLWTLTQKQLKYCLFPIGDYTKPEVRKMAKKFGLPNHDKKDSQGVCFIGPLDMKDFLKGYIKPKSGKIIDQKGNVIGRHDGVYYYTIGQRHGLNIGNGKGPYFVIEKDLKRSIIYVGSKKNLDGKLAYAGNLNWISKKPKFPAELDVKIRYRSKSIPAKITWDNSFYKLQAISYKLPFQAITPGQSAVFYKGEEMLGGGIIVS